MGQQDNTKPEPKPKPVLPDQRVRRKRVVEEGSPGAVPRYVEMAVADPAEFFPQNRETVGLFHRTKTQQKPAAPAAQSLWCWWCW